MCRRVLVHWLVHDCRKPMLVSYVSEGMSGIYANPFSTIRHTCDTSIRTHAHSWLPCLPVGQCEYHSCCIPSQEVVLCERFDGEYDDTEPEMCPGFRLEHRHQQLGSRHTGSICSSPICILNTGSPQQHEVTWPNLYEIEFERTWDPVFNQDELLRSRWEEDIFSLFERLLMLSQDLEIDGAVLHDISSNTCPEGSVLLAIAAGNYLRVVAKGRETAKLIMARMAWARNRTT